MEIKLDPEMQVIAAASKARSEGQPHIADLPIEMVRAGFVGLGQTCATQDIHCDAIEDFAIPSPAGPIGARSYVPSGASGDLMPGMIFIHGGGFMIGDLDSHDSTCRQLANGAGVKVIALDYRLGPEHKFPAAVDDALAAAQWICEHANELGLLPDKIAIGGDSAGGTLSAVVCNHFAVNNGPRLAFQLLIYPAIGGDDETPSKRDLREGVILDQRTLDMFAEGYRGGVEIAPGDPRVAPICAEDHRGNPPTHIVTAEYDPLRDEGKAYGDILRAAGVPVTYHCYPGLMHNFILYTGMVSASRNAVDDMAAAMKQGLAG